MKAPSFRTVFITILLVTLSLFCFDGCQSAYKPFAATVLTADRAFDGWADYVVWQRKQPGYDAAALADKETKVRVVYSQWQSANEAVYKAQQEYAVGTAAGKTNYQNALSAAAAASGNLIDLILSLVPPDRAAKLKGTP